MSAARRYWWFRTIIASCRLWMLSIIWKMGSSWKRAIPRMPPPLTEGTCYELDSTSRILDCRIVPARRQSARRQLDHARPEEQPRAAKGRDRKAVQHHRGGHGPDRYRIQHVHSRSGSDRRSDRGLRKRWTACEQGYAFAAARFAPGRFQC